MTKPLPSIPVTEGTIYTYPDGTVGQRKPRFRKHVRNVLANHKQALQKAEKVKQKADFLAALREGKDIDDIVETLGMSPSTPAMWAAYDPAFDAAWDEAVAYRDRVTALMRAPSLDDKVYEQADNGDIKSQEMYLKAHHHAYRPPSKTPLGGGGLVIQIEWERDDNKDEK